MAGMRAQVTGEGMNDSGLGMELGHPPQSPARSDASATPSGQSYKEMKTVLEDVDKDLDVLTERVSSLNLKVSSRAVKLSMLIDPQLTRFVQQEDDSHPHTLTLSQSVNMNPKEIKEKHEKMCHELDNYMRDSEMNRQDLAQVASNFANARDNFPTTTIDDYDAEGGNGTPVDHQQ